MLERSTTWVCQEGKKARWVNLYQNPSQQLEQTAQINYFLKCFDVGVHCDCEGYTLFKGVTLCADISAQTLECIQSPSKDWKLLQKAFESAELPGSSVTDAPPSQRAATELQCTSFLRCGSARGILADPSCLPGPGSNDSQLSLPAGGFGLQDTAEFSILAHLVFVFARRNQYLEVSIPSVAYPDTPLALGALGHQQKAPESDLFAWMWFLAGLRRLDASRRILSCVIFQWKLGCGDICVGSRHGVENRDQDTGLGL